MKFLTLKNFFLNNKSTKLNIFKLLFSNGIAQLILVLSFPIFTRFYSPGEFGELSIFILLTSVITSLSTLGFEYPIISSKTNAEGKGLFIISCFSSISVFLILLFFANFFSDYLILQDSIIKIRLVFLISLFKSIQVSINFLLNRYKLYYDISLPQILNSLIFVSLAYYLGFSKQSYLFNNNLIISQVISQIISSITSLIILKKNNIMKDLKNINFKFLKFLIKTYKKFPFFYLPSNLVNVLSLKSPIYILALYYPSSFVGFYSMGMNIVITPANLVSRSIGQVFYERLSNAFRNNNISNLYFSAWEKLCHYFVFPISLFCLFSPSIFQVVFGDKWIVSGYVLIILFPYLAIQLTSSPISTLAAIVQRQLFVLKFNLIWLVSACTSLILGAKIGSPYIALILFSIAGFTCYSFKTLIYCSWIKNKIIPTIICFLKPFSIAIFFKLISYIFIYKMNNYQTIEILFYFIIMILYLIKRIPSFLKNVI